jgi:hypothetical protein
MSTSAPDLSDFTPDLSDFTPDAAPSSPGLAHRTNYSGSPIPQEPGNRYEAIGRGIKDVIQPPSISAISSGMGTAKDVLDALVTGHIPGRLGQKIGEQPGAPTYTLSGGHIGEFLSGLKQAVIPQGQFPVAQAIGRVGAMAGMAALGGGEKVPKPTATATASPEMALTSALRPSAKVNVMTVAPDALPALREAAGYLNATPESLQGVHGVVRGQQLVSHALDVLESKFQQLIGPVKQEAVTPAMLQKYPDLADYLGAKDKPTTINDINGARIAKGNQFYSKGTATQQGATGNLLDAKRINGQAADFLYDYIKQRTGVDPSSIKSQQSALLKLKPVMDRTVADVLKQEADFQLNPKQKTAPELGPGDVPTSTMGAAKLAYKLYKGGPPAMSPAEMFNSKMRLVLQGVKPGGPPAMGAPPLIGGPQEFAPAPTQFGSRTGEIPVPKAGGMSAENINAIRQGGEATRRSNAAFIQDIIKRQGLPVDPKIADVEAALKQRAAAFQAQREALGPLGLESQQPTTTSTEDIPPSVSYYDKYGKR